MEFTTRPILSNSSGQISGQLVNPNYSPFPSVSHSHTLPEILHEKEERKERG